VSAVETSRLAAIPLFADLDDADLAAIAAAAVEVEGAGDVFGEVAVLTAGIRMATVVAISPVRLIGLLKRDVWALERRSPETAARLRELTKKRLDFGCDPA
jgi:CRP-like cAMP-binding protein